MKYIKLIALFITMVSLGASAFTSLAGWANTPFEYNAYFQAGIAGCIFLWLSHKAIGATEVRLSHKVTNKRDTK